MMNKLLVELKRRRDEYAEKAMAGNSPEFRFEYMAKHSEVLRVIRDIEKLQNGEEL